MDATQIPDHDATEKSQHAEVQADDADCSEVAETLKSDQGCFGTEVKGH